MINVQMQTMPLISQKMAKPAIKKFLQEFGARADNVELIDDEKKTPMAMIVHKM